MKETQHDYQNCISGNYYDAKCNGFYDTWPDFKQEWLGFSEESYDDTYHFLFRFDINEHSDQDGYFLDLFFLLPRKGIYVFNTIKHVTQEVLDSEVRPWLIARKEYMDNLWSGLDPSTVGIENESTYYVAGGEYFRPELNAYTFGMVCSVDKGTPYVTTSIEDLSSTAHHASLYRISKDFKKVFLTDHNGAVKSPGLVVLSETQTLQIQEALKTALHI